MMPGDWLIDEKLLDKNPELKKDLINTLISMRAVLNIHEEPFMKAMTNNDKVALSYLKALHKSAIHAYEKRLCCFEEYRYPETLIAILQYEFQAEMMLKKTKPPPLVKRYIEYVKWTISSFRVRWKIEPFEDTGLKIGWQHRCMGECKRFFFSLEVSETCPSCGGKAEANEICTIPHGHMMDKGVIIGTSNCDFAPSNGNEKFAIESIKQMLGVSENGN